MQTQYKILRCEEAEDLEEQVTQHMVEGWIPQGGVAFALSESDEYRYKGYAQAMIRETA